MRDRYASLREGLVGAWIPSVSGSGLLLPDLSGNGNNGALTNMGPEDWVSSQYGRALDFDGTNDYVSTGSNAAGRISSKISDSVSLSMWVMTRNVSKYQLAGGGQDTTGIRYSCLINFSTGQPAGSRIGVSTNSVGFDLEVATGQFRFGVSASSNVWYHVVGRYTNADGADFWVNGIKELASTLYSGNIVSFDNVIFGEDINILGTRCFDGQLDDVRIYNRALSEPEIKLLASRPGIGLRPQRRTMYYAPPTGARRRRILTSMP